MLARLRFVAPMSLNLDHYRAYLRDRDPFVYDALGAKVLNFELGRCSLTMTLDQVHVNSFGIAHGGVLFSLADTAAAMAANSFGYTAPAISGTISFTAAVKIGQTVVADAETWHQGRRMKVVHVSLRVDGHAVAHLTSTNLVTETALQPLVDQSRRHDQENST